MMLWNIKKIVMGCAVIVLLLSWFASASLDSANFNYPRLPNPKLGMVVPYQIKGVVAYLTQEQQKYSSFCNWLAFGSGIVVIFVFLLHGGSPFKSKEKTIADS